MLQPGDEVVVIRLDRLGRSMIHKAQLAQGFREGGIGFKSLKDPVDTSTASGRRCSTCWHPSPNMKRELIVERTLAGLEHTRGRMAVWEAAGR